ncbi:type II toxin-antitoxin system VapC family toxin [Oleomonas cavernae]|uniref:type II toxin-antitoxin system VapC family toxin n=1 Tax=Oleomonas cavernae TaxID=2320859 RepID=UPI001314BF57|nr:PIN domain-containing protein [Oleomonas cavernae]
MLLDSSVYVDGIHGNLPADLNDEIGQRALVHSSVVAAELAWAIGALDPLHPQTPQNRESIEQVIRRMIAGNIVVPNAVDWIDAALLAATLSRRQTFDKDHRRKALNDALIFYQARQAGAVLVTRNTKDFDLMDQIVPGTQMLFYERAAV